MRAFNVLIQGVLIPGLMIPTSLPHLNLVLMLALSLTAFLAFSVPCNISLVARHDGLDAGNPGRQPPAMW